MESDIFLYFVSGFMTKLAGYGGKNEGRYKWGEARKASCVNICFTICDNIFYICIIM